MIFVFDVDGTICFNGTSIDDCLKKAIENISKHHQVIFASARPIRDLRPIIDDFEQHKLIGGNGVMVSENECITVFQEISETPYLMLRELIETYHLNYIIDDQWDYAAQVSQNHPIFKQLDPGGLAKQIDIQEIHRPIKVILLDIDESIYSDICKAIKGYEHMLDINYHKAERNIDITAKGITKYTTLRRLIGDEPYIAFGNDINDYDLLKHAQTSYLVQGSTMPSNMVFEHAVKNAPVALAELLNSYVQNR